MYSAAPIFKVQRFAVADADGLSVINKNAVCVVEEVIEDNEFWLTLNVRFPDDDATKAMIRASVY